MSTTELQAEIAQLRSQLQDLQEMDEPTRAELRGLESRIEALLDEKNEEETLPEQVISNIEDAATTFAAQHPKAEGLLRKIAYALGRMGI